MRLSAGAQIGHYTLDYRLGQGGMAEVWAAALTRRAQGVDGAPHRVCMDRLTQLHEDRVGLVQRLLDRVRVGRGEGRVVVDRPRCRELRPQAARLQVRTITLQVLGSLPSTTSQLAVVSVFGSSSADFVDITGLTGQTFAHLGGGDDTLFTNSCTAITASRGDDVVRCAQGVEQLSAR
ncbi:MAG: hypothetical protein AAFV53_42545 [Myxococcota bacterium]